MKTLLWIYLLYSSDFWTMLMFCTLKNTTFKKKSAGLGTNPRTTKQMNQTMFQMNDITSLKEENRKITFEYNIYRNVNKYWTLIGSFFKFYNSDTSFWFSVYSRIKQIGKYIIHRYLQLTFKWFRIKFVIMCVCVL